MTRGTADSFTNRNDQAPIFAVSRLRMGTDGEGITTLVAFMGCPLRCKCCLNPKCHEPVFREDGKTPNDGIMLLTPRELYEQVRIDNIYFQATGGGICFGGGEPTMYVEFIKAFKNICGGRWKITLETSLRCSYAAISRLSDVVDHWIVDVKSMDESICEKYTGCRSAMDQLLFSLNRLVPNDRVTIKVPRIEGFNDDYDLEGDVKWIRQRFGFPDVKTIRYVNPADRNNKKHNSHE